ncbi:MAG: hypothetical protein ACI943_001678, partial [Gammaproteobacteria bacterium]
MNIQLKSGNPLYHFLKKHVAWHRDIFIVIDFNNNKENANITNLTFNFKVLI